MKLIFVDESYQEDSFLVAMISIDSLKYRKLKKEYITILDKYSWKHREDIEFKATDIFSESAGDNDVSIDEKRKIVEELSITSTAMRNSRMQIVFAQKKLEQEEQWDFYYEAVPQMLSKILDSSTKGSHKKVCAIFLDHFSPPKKYGKGKLKKEMRRSIATRLRKKGYIFFEEIFCVKSTIYTMGIVYADLIAYFKLRKLLGGSKNTKKAETMDNFLKRVPDMEEVVIKDSS